MKKSMLLTVFLLTWIVANSQFNLLETKPFLNQSDYFLGMNISFTLDLTTIKRAFNIEPTFNDLNLDDFVLYFDKDPGLTCTLSKTNDLIIANVTIPLNPKFLNKNILILKHKEILIGYCEIPIKGRVPKCNENFKGQTLFRGSHYNFQKVHIYGTNFYTIDSTTFECIDPNIILDKSTKINDKIIELSLKVTEETKEPIKIAYKYYKGINTLFNDTFILKIPLIDPKDNKIQISHSSIYFDDIPSKPPIEIVFPKSVRAGKYNLASNELDFESNEIYLLDSQQKVTINIIKSKIDTRTNQWAYITVKNNDIPYTGSFQLLSKPKILKTFFNGETDSRLTPNIKEHIIEFQGNNLQDLEFYIANPNPYLSLSNLNEYEQAINCRKLKLTINDNVQERPFKKFFIKFKRKYNNSYIISDTIIEFEIIEPRILFTNYNLIAGYSDIRVKKKGTYNKTTIDSDSDILFLIDGKKIDPKFGPQYIEVWLNIYDNKNKFLKSIKYRGADDNSTVCIGPSIYNVQEDLKWNISRSLDEDEIKPWYRISVEINPVRSYYENQSLRTKISEFDANIRGNYFLHNIGLSVSLPPTILAFNWKKVEDSTKNDGTKKTGFKNQVLNLNAGVGFKYNFRRKTDKNYKKLPFSFSTYFLWANLADNDDSEGKIITKGEFTILPAAEISIMNFDSGINVPLIVGCGFTYKSSDLKFIRSLMIGIGLNLKI